MKSGTVSKRRKWPLLAKIGIGLLLFVLVAGIVINLYLNQFIARHLSESIKKGSKGIYALSFTSVRANIFARTIQLKNAQLRVDTVEWKKMLNEFNAPPYLVEGSFPSVRISDIHIFKLLFSSGIVAGSISMQAPDITITEYKMSNDSVKRAAHSNKESLLQNLNGFKINNVYISHGDIQFRVSQNAQTIANSNHIKDVVLEVKDLLAHQKPTDTIQKFSFDKVNLSVGAYEYRSADSLYFIGLKNVQYSSLRQEVNISNIYIRPRLTEIQYSKLPYQKERNDVSFENVRLSHFLIGRFINNGVIDIKESSIGSGHWNIYLSRVPPLPPSRLKVVPSQPLLSLTKTVSIDTLHVQKFQLDYHEYNTATQETGEVRFNDINGKVSNITNDSAHIAKNAHLVAELNARLMGAGNFSARFDFLLSDKDGQFSVQAKLGKMDAQLLNAGFIALDKVEIKKGTIDQMSCTGIGNQSAIRGDVNLLYHGLHIAVMEKDKHADTMKRKTVVSIVANVLVKNDNPKKDEPIRVANNISLKRDPRKSYFNMLWMALFTGIIKIASGK